MEQLAKAAMDTSRVTGATHSFYRYPARFSPNFARTAIEVFSNAGDLVLDPYMGGGTTVVEALRAGRFVIGNDLNSLSVFVARVKTTVLTKRELRQALQWADKVIPRLRYATSDESRTIDETHLRNMNLPRARFIKKLAACAIRSLDSIASCRARDLLRCAILRTAQWALDGRRSHTSLSLFRSKLLHHTVEMIAAVELLATELQSTETGAPRILLRHGDAAEIARDKACAALRRKVDLVVTSPPYPGVHVLYHRWQVDGRRETAAPYWIASCCDGQSDSFYNFGNRHEPGLNSYFSSSLRTLCGVREMMRKGGLMVQLIAFSDANTQLQRYLQNMRLAGFSEAALSASANPRDERRIWRTVPSRKWHATLRGVTASAREVLLVHRAI
jgi:DNA modification methylase